MWGLIFAKLVDRDKDPNRKTPRKQTHLNNSTSDYWNICDFPRCESFVFARLVDKDEDPNRKRQEKKNTAKLQLTRRKQKHLDRRTPEN